MALEFLGKLFSKEEIVKDPVCGMEMEKKKAKETAEYHGRNFYFCNPGCKRVFLEKPESYTK